MSIKNLVLVKINMLKYVHDVRTVREMRQSISDHYVVLCKVRLVSAGIKKDEVRKAGRINRT